MKVRAGLQTMPTSEDVFYLAVVMIVPVGIFVTPLPVLGLFFVRQLSIVRVLFVPVRKIPAIGAVFVCIPIVVIAVFGIVNPKFLLGFSRLFFLFSAFFCLGRLLRPRCSVGADGYRHGEGS